MLCLSFVVEVEFKRRDEGEGPGRCFVGLGICQNFTMVIGRAFKYCLPVGTYKVRTVSTYKDGRALGNSP